MHKAIWLPMIPLVALVVACENGVGPIATGSPANLVIVQGDAQTDTAGRQLAQSIVVKVVDSAGAPISGVAINFHPLRGSVFVGVSISNANGQAGDRWTLDTIAGSQVLEVRYIDLVTFEPVLVDSITATATPARAVSLTIGQVSPALVIGDSVLLSVDKRDRLGTSPPIRLPGHRSLSEQPRFGAAGGW